MIFPKKPTMAMDTEAARRTRPRRPPRDLRFRALRALARGGGHVEPAEGGDLREGGGLRDPGRGGWSWMRCWMVFVGINQHLISWIFFGMRMARMMEVFEV